MSIKQLRKFTLFINPYLTNRLSHHYHLGESTFNAFRGIRSDFEFLSHFSMKFLSANRIAPSGAILFEMGLFCLLMSHKRDVRLI